MQTSPEERGAVAIAPAVIAERLDALRRRVAEAAARAGRAPSDVTIVAVSKTFAREHVDAAYAAGIRHFGENRVQEAVGKFATPLPSDAALHLIGHLQTNKAKAAAALFSIVESVDRAALVDVLARAAATNGVRLPVLLQVNIAREPQKSGCDPEEAPTLVERITASGSLDLQGLMTIAPLVADPEEARPVFRAVRALRDGLRRRYPELPFSMLSMGMSNDFAVAIEEGATHVRVGRAIFGERG